MTTPSNALPETSFLPVATLSAEEFGADSNVISAALNQSFGEILRPSLLALSCMYLVFLVIDAFSLSANSAYEGVILLDAVTFAIVAGGWLYFRPTLRFFAASHAIATFYVGLMLVNHSVSIHVIHDPQYANDLAILMIGSGCLFLSTFWLSIVVCMVLATWGYMLAFLPDIALSPYMFASSTGVAVFVHLVRVRTIRRMEALRLGEKAQKECAHRALESAQRELEARKRAEEEQQRLELELRQSQKLEAIGRLAGGVAHDFNNLLTGILGYSNMLKLELSPDDPHYETVDVIEKAAERGSMLTRQLLGFARKGKHQVVNLDLRSTAHEVVTFIQRTFNRNIRIIEDYHEGPSTVRGDATQIYQVILNLVVNAQDALAQGGDLRLTTAIIPRLVDEEQSAEDRRPRVRLSVSDTGPGVPEEIRERIFEPFFTTKDPDRGTGMGLATAYGIVQNHEGGISLETELGKGSTFSIDLPLVEAEIVTDETTKPGPAGGKVSGRILVVDDEEMVRRLAKTMLIKLGYEVVTSENGIEAVETYRNASPPFDLVLLDMIMPGMDGRECFLALKGINPDVRAVISSGYSQEGSTQESLDDGVRGFVQKPYRLSELSSVIEKAMHSE